MTTRKLLVLLCCLLTADAFVRRTPTASSTAIFYQNEQADMAVAHRTPLPVEKPKVVVQIKKKPTIYPISSLDELHGFLQEDDDRLTAIKFFAPWCKQCQRLGKRYQRLAMKEGDGVDRIARKAITGRMRCAEVKFGNGTSRFIHDQLQIEGLPTLQLYKGTTKLWQGRGGNSIKELEKEVEQLLILSPSELEELVSQMEDDGILEEAVEDAFFDNAYCD